MRERMAAASSSMAKASAKAAASLKKGAAIAGEGAKLAAAAAAKQGAELVRKIEAAEPGKATVRRLVEGALNDWVEGGIGAEWRDEDDEVVDEAVAEPSGGESGGGVCDDGLGDDASPEGPAARPRAEAGGAPSCAKRASLQVSLRKGEVVLRDVTLRRRALEPLGASCLSVESGSVGEVRVVFPWAHLGSRPVRVSLRRVDLRVRLTRDDDDVVDDGAAKQRVMQLHFDVALRGRSERGDRSSQKEPPHRPRYVPATCLTQVDDADRGGEGEDDGDTRRHELDLLEALKEHWTALCESGEDKSAASRGFGRRVAARALERVDVPSRGRTFTST